MKRRRRGCSAEIRALAELGSDLEIMERLQEIASRYGKVLGVSRLPVGTGADQDTVTFLIDFEKIPDAMAAAWDLDCSVFGHSSLIIYLSLPAGDSGGHPQDEPGAA